MLPLRPTVAPEATLTAAELEHLVLMATYAPSVHNTQPWVFVPVPDGLLVRADRSRQLSVLDPYGRALLLSCGAALHHLCVAARGIGLDAEVELLLSPEAPDDVAVVTLRRSAPAGPADVASAVAVLHRHTHRGRFPSDDVPAALLDRLHVVVEGQGGMLRVVRPDELVELEVLVSASEETLLRTPAYVAELADWVWKNSPQERADGLPPAAVDHGPDRAESLQGRQFGGEALARPQEPPPAEHPVVVLLTTLADEPRDWVHAGRALSALLLAATELEALAQPIGQVIDVPATRWSMQRLLGTVGVPQMLLRLGSGTTVGSTPRRAVSEVYAPSGGR